jgi:hypothetical protein
MLFIAKDFFNNQKVHLPSKEAFFESDLSKYFSLLYRGKPYYSDKGLIKVIKEDNGYSFYEHIFYDWSEGKEADCYINIEGINLLGTNIINNNIGKHLSKKGYWGYQHPEWVINVLSKFPSFKYNRTGCEHSNFEPYATHKFGTQIWENKNPIFENEDIKIFYEGINKYMTDLVSYSEVLLSLDAYDMNTLEWRKGRSMEPHNGVDYRSMVNLITSNTDHCDSSRHLMVGEYDWYDTVFYCAASQDWEPLLNISTERVQSDAFLSDTKLGVLVNVFNPKFYHQVGEFKGEGKLYVCTANKTFRSIVDRFNFNW